MAEGRVLTSVRGYARHRTDAAARGEPGFEKTSHVAVLKAIASGRIADAVVELEGEKQVDVAKADELWSANTDPMKQRDGAAAEGGGSGRKKKFAEVRLELLKWQARREKLDYLREKGKLIPEELARKTTFELSRALRERVLEVPDRTANTLAVETNHRKVHALLMRELAAALALPIEEALAIARGDVKRTPPKTPPRKRAARRGRARGGRGTKRAAAPASAPPSEASGAGP